MTERCSLWSALSAAACCFYRGSFVQVQVRGRRGPSPAGAGAAGCGRAATQRHRRALLGEGPAAAPGTQDWGAAVPVLPPPEGAGWALGSGVGVSLSWGPAARTPAPEADGAARLPIVPGAAGLGSGGAGGEGREAERMPRGRGRGARRPPALPRAGPGRAPGAGLSAPPAGQCGTRRGGGRVKRKGVEGRTRTPPLCGASSGMALLG